MRRSAIAGLAAMILAMAAPALAAEVTLVRDVEGPEGPLFVDGALYYVAYVGSTLSKWDGKTVTVLNADKSCDHNGLALTAQKTFLVACDADEGAVLELDMAGKELRRWTGDTSGRKFGGGLNDIAIASDGGAYATLTVAANAPRGTATGKVFYRAPGAKGWIEVASKLKGANGIGLSPDGKTLYVAETGGNAVQKFTVARDGRLAGRALFAALDTLIPNPAGATRAGPDSLKLDARGNLYVAQLMCSRILKISPEGKLLGVIPVAAGIAPTNLAFGPGEKDIYVTVVTAAGDPKAKGSVVRISNPR